jgi:hypothetical protein
MSVDLYAELEAAGLRAGRQLSGSKTGKAGHRYFWNACIFEPDECKDNPPFNQIWWGDVDVSTEEPVLQEIATRTGMTFYLTREHPYRFDGLTKKDIKKPDLNRVIPFEP